jgi:hypothetical protein
MASRENSRMAKKARKPESTEVTIRRAPRVARFLILGGALGALGTLIATTQFKADPAVGYPALFGYFALYGIPAGVAVGALVALMFDRISIKRAKAATAEVVESADESSADDSS